eukprot:TRINITY_DN4091_c0_g1_i5.p1 TRINITY_DN4091_c0_g1~~TRINITY_DN4091_c0_g1_i5.p1  ORF type:complete len:1205 (-),score=331.70 TRINITY_DN4091_c0_g1_i5:105-3719(-)
MTAINDNKVEEFLRALSTAKESLNRSEKILGLKTEKSVPIESEELSNSPASTTLDGLLRCETPTHSYTSMSLNGLHGMLNDRSPFDSFTSHLPLEPSELTNPRHNMFGVNGGAPDSATSRHKSELFSLNTTTQFLPESDKRYREESLERRLGELREENNRLVTQSRRGQGMIDELKLKLTVVNNKVEQTQSDLANELKQKTFLQDRIGTMENRVRSIQQEYDTQKTRVAELEGHLLDRSNHLGQLERELGIRSDEMKNLKRSYETVSKTLEQTVTSQSRLREALGQSKEREREGGLLSEERLAQLQSAESQLFETQRQLELARSPNNQTAAENASLKDKVSALSKQASKFQLELTTARSQLKLMEGLAVRLESPSPGNSSAERSELNNKDRQIRLLESQLTEKTRSSADHVEQLQQLQRQITKLRKEKEQTKAEFDAKLQTELDRLKVSHSDHSREFETQLATSSERFRVAKQELDTLRNQLIDAKRKEVALVAQNETLSTQSATLTHKLQLTHIGRSQQLEALQRESEEGVQNVRQLELELKKCRDELERQATQLMTSEHEKRDRITGLEMELKLSRQDLQQVMETANSRTRELQMQIQVSSSLEEKVVLLQTEWDERLQQKEVLVADLQGKVSQSGALLTDLKLEQERLQNMSLEQGREVAGLRTQLATTEGENRALEQQARLVEQVRIELKQSREKEVQLSLSLSATKERVGELSGAKNQLMSTLANEEKLSSELKTVRSELESRRGEAREWRERADSLQRNTETRSRELERKGQQVLELEQAFHRLKTDAGVRGSEQERSLLQGQGEIRSLKERVAELSSEVSNMRRHNSSLEADNKKFEEQLLRHKNVTMDSQDKHTQALQELQRARRETQEVTHQLKSIKDILTSKESQLEQLTRQLDTSTQSVIELEKRCEKSTRSLEVAQQNTRSIQEESRKTIGRLETETNRLRQQLELSSKQSHMQSQRIQEIHAQEMARHEQEMTSLRLDSKHKQDKFVTDSRDLSRLQTAHATLSAELSAERECSARLRQSLSLKESEVTRVTARLSGLERQLTMHTMRQEPLSISRTSSRSSVNTPSLEVTRLPSLTNITPLPDTFVPHQPPLSRIETHSWSSNYQSPSLQPLQYDNQRNFTPHRLSGDFTPRLPLNTSRGTPGGEGVNLSLTQLAEDLAKAVSHPQPLPYLSPADGRSPKSNNQSINFSK